LLWREEKLVERKIILELTIHEAEILRMAIATNSPSKENEAISYFIYNRIKDAIRKAVNEESP
jgi:hypothetical protein